MMVNNLPPRPIAGGTNNDTRPIRFDYWRTGYGDNLPNQLDFYIAQAGEFHPKPMYQTGTFELAGLTEFFYHIDGQADLEYSGQQRSLAVGDLLIIPIDVEFLYTSSQGAKYHWFGLRGDCPPVLGEPKVKIFSLGQNTKIETLFSEIREILILREPGYPLRAIGTFYHLMAHLESITHPAAWPESTYPETIRNAVIFLRENSYAPYDAAQTAAAVGLSQSHLRALFEKWLGESPGRFHMRCRIDLAKRLLTEQHLSAIEVATHIGFADVHHFSRAFKRMSGLSPTQYLRQHTP